MSFFVKTYSLICLCGREGPSVPHNKWDKAINMAKAAGWTMDGIFWKCPECTEKSKKNLPPESNSTS